MPTPASSPGSAARRRLCLALISALAPASALTAANLLWDPSNTANGTTIDAGSGTWNTAVDNLVWNNAGTNVAWTQTSATASLNSAQFGGADAPVGSPYLVTLATSVAVGSANNALWFSHSGYELSASGTTKTVTVPQVTTSSGKTSTISGTINVTPASNAPLTINGFGTLTVKSGARLAPNANNLSTNHGTNVILATDGGISTSSQVIVGAGTANTTPTTLTVSGGSIALGTAGTPLSTAQNLVICNVNAGTATATLNIDSGTVTNIGVGRASSTESGLRFGATVTGGTVTGTVNLNGGTLTVARVYEGAASSAVSTFNFNGGTLKVQAGAGNAANFLTGLDTAAVKEGGAVIDTNGVATTIAQALLHGGLAATDGGLVKSGAGTLTLTGANTYNGATVINAGSLAISAPYSNVTATTVNAGGRLQIVTGTSASTLPGLTLATDGGVELNLGIYDGARLATAAVAPFSPNGDYKVDLLGTNVPVGDFTVFTYSDKTGTGLPVVGALPAGVTATVEDTGTAVILHVLTPQVPNYFWSAGTGAWDTTTANWNGTLYTEGGYATFPDLAGDNTITLSAARTPYAVSILNNSGNTYTFSGAALGGSGVVDKTGSGIVTFASENTYTGATQVAAGTLLVSANNALGTTDGSTSIGVGASLGLANGVNYTTAEPVVGSGAGNLVALGSLAVQRGIVQAVSGNCTFAGPITINATGTTRIGVQAGASLTLTGPIQAASGTTGVSVLFRTANDGDFVTLTSPNNQWDGPTFLFSGTPTGVTGLRLGANNAVPVASTVIGGGTSGNTVMTFDLAGYSQTLNGLGASNGFVSIQNSSTLPSVLTLDLLTSDVFQPRTDALPNLTTIHDGPGGGGVSLVKKGTFKQTLAGVHSYSGPTSIEAGTLAFIGTGALGATPVTLHSGATLDVSGITIADFPLNGGLSGTGTVTATGKSVTVSSAFAPVALTMTGNLALSTGTASSWAAATGVHAVTLTGALSFNGTLAITPAAAAFASGESFTFATATGGITTGLTGVSVAGTALTESTPDVWTGTASGLNYSFDEATAALTVTSAVVISPVQAWRNIYFPADGNDGTGIGANDADPDGDGYSNLLEYATGSSPIATNASAVTVSASGGLLSLTFPRVNDPSLTYTVTGRSDLTTGAWLPVVAVNNPSTGGTTPVTVQDEAAMASQPRRFLRLEVSITP